MSTSSASSPSVRLSSSVSWSSGSSTTTPRSRISMPSSSCASIRPSPSVSGLRGSVPTSNSSLSRSPSKSVSATSGSEVTVMVIGKPASHLVMQVDGDVLTPSIVTSQPSVSTMLTSPSPSASVKASTSGTVGLPPNSRSRPSEAPSPSVSGSFGLVVTTMHSGRGSGGLSGSNGTGLGQFGSPPRNTTSYPSISAKSSMPSASVSRRDGSVTKSFSSSRVASLINGGSPGPLISNSKSAGASSKSVRPSPSESALAQR